MYLCICITEKTTFSFLDGQKKYPGFQGISFVVLNLKEGYSKSNVWLFSLGFVVRAFLPHGCADRWLTLLCLMDLLIHGLTRSFLMRSLTDFHFAL
jgi:hypothetical protein